MTASTTRLHGPAARLASGPGGDRSASAGPWPGATTSQVAAECACGRDTVITVAAGCVHEHLHQLPLCQYCVAEVATGRAFCGDCVKVDGHECVLAALAEVAS